MKLIDLAFKAHFSRAFLPEIPPGNFIFVPEISNFTLSQFLHETSYVANLIYKHCTSHFVYSRLGGRNHPRFNVVLTGYNRPGQYSLKWSLPVNTHQSGLLEILSGFVCFVVD